MSAAYRRLAFSVVLVLAVLAGTACRRLRARVAHASDRNGTLEIGGLTRRYFVHAPPSNDSKPLPLVLVLHGATQSPENVEEMSGMSAAADREGFLAVYPRGTGR